MAPSRPTYDAIEAAVLNIGGWMDAYVDAAFRMQKSLTAPSRTIVGNWVHGLPSSATPGPNLDELHEMVRFFDRWLKGIENGADAEPAITWFEREYAEPEPFPVTLPGRWRAASAYPHPAVGRAPGPSPAERSLLVGRLVRGADRGRAPPVSTDYRHRPTVGTRAALSWGAGGPPNGLARDLRPDEAFGPTYTSEPLDGALEILGVPEVVLHLSASSPVATVVVRLTDVAPDGTSAQVSAGILNLTHRRSHDDPATARAGTSRGDPSRASTGGLPVPARPSHPGLRGLLGVAGDVAVAIRDRLRAAPRAGHAVSPRPAGHPARRRPGRRARAGVQDDTARTQPEVGGEGSADQPVWHITDDVIEGTVTVTVHDGGEDVLDDGRRLYAAETLVMTASDANPARAMLDADVVYRWQDHDFQTEIRARSTQTSDAAAFDLTVDLDVDVDGEPFFRRTWHEVIERRLV